MTLLCIIAKVWFRESLNECDSLNSHNKMSYGSTRPFIATCFFANCYIDLNHALEKEVS